MGGAPPLRDPELDGLFAGLASEPTLLVAVSGGADSLGLLHLLARWRDTAPPDASRPALVAATVDHRLRAESATEAQVVAAVAGRLGVPHHTLAWTAPRPTSGLQQAARAARYRLLRGLAREVGATAIATAHTLEDQAETLLMRLARGSGVDGLAAMRAREGDVCRPLLGTPRARLEATLRDAGQAWIEDPSNQDPAFERIRIRQARTHLEGLGLTPAALARSARRLDRARLAIEAQAARLWNEHVALNGGAYARLQRARLAAEPDELQIRLLMRLLAAFGSEPGALALAKAEVLAQRLAAPAAARITLGGAVFSPEGCDLLVWRERGRRPLPEVDVSDGGWHVWDRRFAVRALPAAPGLVAPGLVMAGLVVAPLGDAGLATVRASLPPPGRLPREAARTLPALWSEGRLLCVPFPDAARGLGHTPAPLAQDSVVLEARFLHGNVPHRDVLHGDVVAARITQGLV